jgi:hypothetical protein
MLSAAQPLHCAPNAHAVNIHILMGRPCIPRWTPTARWAASRAPATARSASARVRPPRACAGCGWGDAVSRAAAARSAGQGSRPGAAGAAQQPTLAASSYPACGGSHGSPLRQQLSGTGCPPKPHIFASRANLNLPSAVFTPLRCHVFTCPTHKRRQAQRPG